MLKLSLVYVYFFFTLKTEYSFVLLARLYQPALPDQDLAGKSGQIQGTLKQLSYKTVRNRIPRAAGKLRHLPVLGSSGSNPLHVGVILTKWSWIQILISIRCYSPLLPLTIAPTPAMGHDAGVKSLWRLFFPGLRQVLLNSLRDNCGFLNLFDCPRLTLRKILTVTLWKRAVSEGGEHYNPWFSPQSRPQFVSRKRYTVLPFHLAKTKSSHSWITLGQTVIYYRVYCCAQINKDVFGFNYLSCFFFSSSTALPLDRN